MNRTILLLVLFAVAGLVVGYFLFAKAGNSYIRVADLIAPAKQGLAGVGQRIMGAVRNIDQVRQNILISGGVGAVIGLVVGLAGKRSG